MNQAEKMVPVISKSRLIEDFHFLWSCRAWVIEPKSLSFLFPFFALMTPFLSFIDYQEYGLFHPEIGVAICVWTAGSILYSWGIRRGGFLFRNLLIFSLIGFFTTFQFGVMGLGVQLGIIVLGGLLLLCFQEAILVILCAVFAPMFMLTFSQALGASDPMPLELTIRQKESDHASLPRLIHLVLDEHIGIEGISDDLPRGPEMKAGLKEFYQENGFQVFGGAYSHYYRTFNSISNMLNFTSSATNGQYFGEEQNPYVLKENQYFEMLVKSGYRLHVVWGHHIDYCSKSLVMIETCLQLPQLGLRLSQDLPLNLSERLELLFSLFLNLSPLYQEIREIYEVMRNEGLRDRIELPIWSWDRHRVTTLTYLHYFHELLEQIVNLPPGHALYAHLLLPHFPYIANGDCSIKSSIYEWKYSSLTFSPWGTAWKGAPNTDTSRKLHYENYFEQVGCVNKNLRELFQEMKGAGIFENSIIIIHGDHGSKIVREFPMPSRKIFLSPEIIKDAYSALFAVKVPGEPGGYDDSPKALEELLAKTVGEQFSFSTTSSFHSTPPFIYLPSTQREEMERVTFPGYSRKDEEGTKPFSGKVVDVDLGK